MKLIGRILAGIRRPALVEIPGDLTAVLEPMFTDGQGDGPAVALTGFPHFLGTETDGEGIRYVRLRNGLVPVLR
jgi:hypothetical protein